MTDGLVAAAGVAGARTASPAPEITDARIDEKHSQGAQYSNAESPSSAKPQDAAGAPNGSPMLTIALLTAVLAVAFEAYGTLTAMPVASEQLGNLELYAWTATAFTIANVLSIVAAGRFGDKKGPGLPLFGGMTIFIIGLLVGGFAPSMTVLLLGRFVQGFGGGAVNVALMMVIALAYHGRRRADLMGWFSFCWVLPAFIGPPIAAWITEHISWHWVFLGVVPVVLVSALLAVAPLIRVLGAHQTNPAETLPVPLSAALIVAVATAGLQLAGQRLDLISIPIAALSLAALAWLFPKLMPAGFTRLREGLPALTAARLFVAGSFFAGENFMTLLLIQRYELRLTVAGMFLILGSVGWTAGSFVQGRSFVTIGRHRLVQLGAALLVAGNLLLAFAAWTGSALWLVVVGYTITGLGTGLVISVVSLANMLLSAPSQLGRNTSSLQVADAIGNALITGLAGTIFVALRNLGAGVEFLTIYLACAAVGLIGLAISRRIGVLPAPSEDA